MRKGIFLPVSSICRSFYNKSYNDLVSNVLLGSIRTCSFCDRSNDSSSRPQGPLTVYRDMVKQGKLRHDIHQEKVAYELEDLLRRLDEYEKEMEEYHAKLANWERSRDDERRKLLLEEAQIKQQDGVWTKDDSSRSSFIGDWFYRRKRGTREPGVGRMVSYLNREKKLDSLLGRPPTAPSSPKGLYLYGNVGSGKTMLMDMFYQATDGIVKHRKRFHFHEAMLEINQHMHDVWKNRVGRTEQSSISSWVSNLPFDTKVKEWLYGEEKYKEAMKEKHILPDVADKFLVDRKTEKSGASILCFDEIQV